jgi:HK97 family phage major capsid protein
MKDFSKDLKDLKGKIKSLSELENMTDEQADELTKYMGDYKRLQLRLNAQELGKTEEPVQSDPDADLRFKALSDQVDVLIKRLENTPGIDAAGLVTNAGGTSDKNIKTFGDFLIAVKRKDDKRLREVYKSIKTLEEDGGASGGYLVPEEFRTELLAMPAFMNQVAGLATRVPVGTDAGSYPALDQFAAPTAGVGNTAFAAGANLAATAESGTLPNNEPSFEEIQWRVHKIGDLVYVSSELMADSPQSIEGILRSLFQIAISAKEEFFALRGTGAGEPLGILNSSAAYAMATVTNGVFAYQDAANMISRFHQYLSPGRWIMHPSVFPDVATWEIGTSGAGLGKLADFGKGDAIFSEHMPQANGDDVLLADMRAYVFFDRQAMTIDFSEHAAFTTDRVVWRVKERIDGMPWLKNTITLADPDGSYTVSPFVYHDD